MKRSLGIVLLISLMISIVGAVTCSPPSLSTSFTQGVPSSVLTSCYNPSNASVSVSQSGSGFTLDTSILNPFANNTIRATFNENANSGTYSGSIDFNDSSASIPILWIINSPTPPSTCSINIFPTTLSNIKVQQGDTSSRNIQVSVPGCYSSPVTIQGVALSTNQKPIQLGELSVGTLQPGQSANIPISLDATNVAVGSYSDQLSLLLYNSSGNQVIVPNTDISVLVTAGISPITNFTSEQLPTCSINPTDIGLNQTATLTCSLPNPNFEVHTDIDYAYFVGISSQKTSTQYIYTFKSKKTGVTDFVANFIYAGGQIGEPYNQSLRITQGTASSGVNLSMIFYQGGASKDAGSLEAADTIIQIVDGLTKYPLESSVLYIGGVPSNKTLNMELGKSYELTATASGYLPLSMTISVSNNTIPITLDPSKTAYNVGDIVNITSSIEGVSFLLDNQIITSPYTFQNSGNFILKAIKEGYANTEMNISVSPNIYLTGLSPSGDLKKGDSVTMDLNKEVSWIVQFLPENSSSNAVPMVLSSSTGSRVSFKMDKLGTYKVVSGDFTIWERSLQKSSGWAGLQPWIKGVIIIGGLLILIYVVSRLLKKKGSSDEDLTEVGAG